jgi:hypothetical protein
MKRLLSASVLLLLLAACKPSTNTTDNGRVMDGTGLMIRLEQNITYDKDAIPHNKAIMHVTGVAEADIDLGDVYGDLLYVDPASYPTYSGNENMPETVAMFTTWFAGQGEEFNVKLQNQNLIIDHRYGDEQGTCTELMQVTSIPLGKDVVVEWDSLPEKTDKSSLAFCDKK